MPKNLKEIYQHARFLDVWHDSDSLAVLANGLSLRQIQYDQEPVEERYLACLDTLSCFGD
jgi:hypothetical protein